MAGTLTEGVQYGLSSNGLPSENKSLVFVKLTDSSFKAIEEYLRIKLKTQQQPNIQFLGNEGRLWFPTTSSADGGGGAAFSFSLSSSAVAGGPQGSFECVQQCGSRSLESLGVMALKMNVKAKDDVYEATRQRMAVAEEESKKNCTRVIKLACGPDIGRVVKIRKQAAAVLPPRRERERPEEPTSGHTPVASHRSTSSSSSSLSLSSSSSSSLYPSSTHHSHHVQNGRTSTSSPALGSSTAMSNGRTSNAISPLPRSAASPSYNTTAATSSIASRAPAEYQAAGSEVNPDLMRRQLRERIIHLLAIRPYKKPELVSRLHKEGLKEKDKKLIMPVLTAVGLIKDQAYHLARHIWNDIQDDWPFYSESERQILKRRKPQNLTPPVSDSSSGSGHSPPSSSSGLHHNGSPVGSSISSSSSRPNASPSSGGVKRLQHEALLDAAAAAVAAAKKPRISHYKKPDSSQPQSQQQSQSSSHYSSSTMQPDSRHAQQQQQHHQQVNSKSSPSLKVRPSPPGGNHQPSNNPPPHHHHYQQQQQQQQPPSHPYRSGASSLHQHHPSSNGHHYRSTSDASAAAASSVPVVSTRVTSSTDGPDTPNSSPDSMAMDSDLLSSGNGGLNHPSSDFEAEYTLQYQPIVSGEQRSRYKEDFNAQYSEYRDLHKAIDKVSKRFAQLEEELRQQHEGTVAYKRIKHQILREYRDNLRDTKYRETKRRFQHLHEKLAHIKRLVLEWDMAQTCRS